MRCVVWCAFVSVSLCALWPCTFKDPDGYEYDFTSINTNASDSNGLYMTSEPSPVNLYSWKLCDQTTSVSSYTPCANKTQVCQHPGVGPNDKSCGLGQPVYSYLPNGTGVTMYTSGGLVGCSPSTARTTTLNVRCAATFSRQNGAVDSVLENPSCIYTINMYFTAACGKKRRWWRQRQRQ